jgi:hypothetical protein
MSQINPFTGSILQTPQAQRLAEQTRDARVQRNQRLRRNTSATEAQDEYVVENADELAPSGDAPRRERPAPDRKPKKKQPPADDEPGASLDVTG